MKHKLAKILLLLLLISALICCFAACNNDTDENGDSGQTSHVHSGGTATCEDAAKCAECGEAYGKALGHIWSYECNSTMHKQVCTRSGCSEVIEGDVDKANCTVCNKGELLEYKLSDGKDHYTVVGIGSVTSPNVVVPAEHNGLPVSTIGERAFVSCKDIETVVISEGITSIEKEAFMNCANVKSVALPSTLTEIGESVFSNCKSLKSANIPEKIKKIPFQLFNDCASLENVNISNGVEEIGNYVFSGCEALKDLEIPDTVTELGYAAFSDCKSLESFAIPPLVTEIPGQLLYGCSLITEIDIGNNITRIGELAFVGTSLVNVVFPESIDTLESGVFLGCSDLVSVTARGVKRIEDEAFALCESLSTVILSDRIEYAGALIADGVPDTLISVYKGMEYFGPQSNPYAVIVGRRDDNVKIVDIHPDTTCIEGYLFSESDITAVTGGGSVISIGENAFDKCGSLISFNVGDSVETIGECAFYDCVKLIDFKWSSSLKSIGDKAFFSTDKLPSIELGANVEYIGDLAFAYAAQVNFISVSGENEYYYADGNCLMERATKKLIRGCQDSTIPDDTLVIGEYAFMRVPLPSAIRIPDSVTIIEDFAFCSEPPSYVIVGKNLTTFGLNVFGDDADAGMQVFYLGTEAEWNRITIKTNMFYHNLTLRNAIKYFYSEEEPVTEGNFWHYVDGVPTPW